MIWNAPVRTIGDDLRDRYRCLSHKRKGVVPHYKQRLTILHSQDLRAQLQQERDSIRHLSLQKDIELKELRNKLDKTVGSPHECHSIDTDLVYRLRTTLKPANLLLLLRLAGSTWKSRLSSSTDSSRRRKRSWRFMRDGRLLALALRLLRIQTCLVSSSLRLKLPNYGMHVIHIMTDHLY